MADRQMILHIVERAGTSRFVDQVVLATSFEPRDDSLSEFLHERRNTLQSR